MHEKGHILSLNGVLNEINLIYSFLIKAKYLFEKSNKHNDVENV